MIHLVMILYRQNVYSLIGNQNSIGTNKSSLGKNSLSQNTNLSDNIISDSNEKETEKPAIFTNKND